MLGTHEYIKSWDNIHCEKHVINLINNITNILCNYYSDNTPICLIDIGANVGKVYDLLSKKITIDKAYLFEANKDLYNYLLDKYKDNSNISIYHNAVSLQEKSLYFDESSIEYQINNKCEDLNFGLSKITTSQTNKMVDGIKISNFLNKHKDLYSHRCFIKIDTENCDYQILSDLIDVIDLFTYKPIIEFENNYFVDGYDILWAQNIIDQYNIKGYKKLIVDRNMGDGILEPNYD